MTVGAHTGIGMLPIVFSGTEAQKAKYLPELATAVWISSYSLSELGYGSDALAAQRRMIAGAKKIALITRGRS